MNENELSVLTGLWSDAAAPSQRPDLDVHMDLVE
jgi:hypothetical protein